MRSIFKLSVMCLAMAAVNACKLDEVIRTENIPTAGVRFINAVPDTQAVDFRFVDMVESNAHFNIAFRNTPTTSACVTGSPQIQFKAARAGMRHFRIFLSDTVQSAASQVIKDTTVNLEAGKNYTALLWGYARAGSTPAMKLSFFEDNPADPGAQVALRVFNATGNTIDVRQYATTATIPAAATFAGLAPLTVSQTVLVAPAQIRFNVRPVGGTGEPADALALIGAAATVGFDPLPGTTIAGSAVTAIVFPASVVGSEAAQTTPFRPTSGALALSATATTFTRPTGSFLTDCFYVGGQATISGFANPANNGTGVVTAVTALALTISRSTANVVERGTTGSTSLSATATGYARAAGSFVTDGFVVGQTIVASGFATTATGSATPINNGQSVITAITAADLTVTKTPANVVEAAATGRTIVSLNARTISGVRPSELVSFIWDRRPPRL